MRIVTGKHVRPMDPAGVAAWTASHRQTTVDLGAGDGRFVRHLARQYPEHGAIGVDLCEANLRVASRSGAGNALFVVADALALPGELGRVAARVTVNFPWGSLLRGLLTGHPGLMTGLGAIGNGGASLEIGLNAGALAEAGWTLEAGSERVSAVLRDAGVGVEAIETLGAADLRRWPTTWAKRLAFGRDPRAVRIEARLCCPHSAAEVEDAQGVDSA
jgi:16S rRNA (adenine(1408)-N(1))-methyltransferase